MLLMEDPEQKLRQEAKSIDLSNRSAATDCNNTIVSEIVFMDDIYK